MIFANFIHVADHQIIFLFYFARCVLQRRCKSLYKYLTLRARVEFTDLQFVAIPHYGLGVRVELHFSGCCDVFCGHSHCDSP